MNISINELICCQALEETEMLSNKSVTIKEYKCITCKKEKPEIFFGATNGKINITCKKCKLKLINKKINLS